MPRKHRAGLFIRPWLPAGVIGRQEPRLVGDAVPQRKHVEDRQSIGEKTSELAAIKSDEDGTRKRTFHDLPLQHIGLEVADCPFIHRSFTLEPFGGANAQFGQQVRRWKLRFRRHIRRQASRAYQIAEKAGFEPAATGRLDQILVVRMDACCRVAIQRRVRIGEDQSELGARLIDFDNARQHRIEKVQAGQFRRCQGRPQALTPILHEGNGRSACVSLSDELQH